MPTEPGVVAEDSGQTLHKELPLLQKGLDDLKTLILETKADIAHLQSDVLNIKVLSNELKDGVLFKGLVDVVQSSLAPVGFRLSHLELEVYQLSQDFVAWPDYALLATGGHILQELTAVNGTSGEDWKDAEKMLDGKVDVSACWSFHGDKAQAGLYLASRVHIDQVSIDHIPKELVPSADHAPKEIIVWGIVDAENIAIAQHASLPSVLSSLPTHPPLMESPSTHVVPLAVILYDLISPSHVQTFPVLDYLLESSADFQKIIVQVVSNYGAESTCIYRIRVHGTQHNKS